MNSEGVINALKLVSQLFNMLLSRFGVQLEEFLYFSIVAVLFTSLVGLGISALRRENHSGKKGG